MEYFASNMTPFVQPCDAGIIHSFKTHYQCHFNQHIIGRDAAGKWEIYKIDLLDAMMMAKKAWNTVKPEIVQNCWNLSET